MRHSAVLIASFALSTFGSSSLFGAPLLQNAFPNLPAFNWPVDLQAPYDGSDRLFVVEKDGRICVIDNDPAVSTRTLIHSAGSLARGGRVDVFDVRGRRVRSLGFSGGGEVGSVAWNGTDDQGLDLASGVYFARLTVDGRDVAHQRLVLVR